MDTVGLRALIRATYDTLALRTYFTCGPEETRAWTIRRGTRAPQAAGVIHSDFERGFIRAETVGYAQLIDAGSLATARERGLVRSEGKEGECECVTPARRRSTGATGASSRRWSIPRSPLNPGDAPVPFHPRARLHSLRHLLAQWWRQCQDDGGDDDQRQRRYGVAAKVVGVRRQHPRHVVHSVGRLTTTASAAQIPPCRAFKSPDEVSPYVPLTRTTYTTVSETTRAPGYAPRREPVERSGGEAMSHRPARAPERADGAPAAAPPRIRGTGCSQTPQRVLLTHATQPHGTERIYRERRSAAVCGPRGPADDDDDDDALDSVAGGPAGTATAGVAGGGYGCGSEADKRAVGIHAQLDAAVDEPERRGRWHGGAVWRLPGHILGPAVAGRFSHHPIHPVGNAECSAQGGSRAGGGRGGDHFRVVRQG
eukprot:ctg_791.g304